jgi:CRP/FNR family transcriptional regulator, cyclic AMP receptor protein
MESVSALLVQQDFFKELTSQQIELISSCASTAQFEAGQMIFREGQPADAFYLVRHGKVSIELYSPSRGTIVIQTLTAGDVLGWSWLVQPYEWHFDARAVELTRTVTIDARCLRTKCEQDVHLAVALYAQVVTIVEQRLMATRLQLLDVYGKK